MTIIKKLVTLVMHNQVIRLDGLYQRNLGQECYVFGDGISLKWMDLHQFADRVSIIGNQMIYHKEIPALKIPYCANTEPCWFWPIYPYPDRNRGKERLRRHTMHREYRTAMDQNPDTTFFLNVSNYPVARFSNAIYVSRWYQPPFETKNPFRERADAHHGTLRFQISLAIYLGFKKAYLVGHDYTHSPSRNLHFYEKGRGILMGDRHKDFSREFLDYAKQQIDLVTVTLDGGSKTMNHITYKELTGREPNFRENVELVDRVKLENLAKWQGYSIF